MARIHETVHEYQKALDSLDRASQSAISEGGENPRLDAVWLAAAKVAKKMENLKVALGYVQKAVKHNPENSEAREMLEDLN